MGMDRRQVEFAVAEGFEKLIKGLPDEELDLEQGVEPDETMRREAFARRYLEKLINIEIPVPRLDEDGLKRLLRPDITPPPVEEGPPWLSQVSTAANAALQIARVMFLAIILGLVLLPWLDHIEHMTPAAGQTIEAAKRVGSPGPATPSTGETVTPRPAVDTPGRAPMTVDLPIQELDPEDMPGAGRWLWWGPTVVLIAFSLLWMVGMAARRRDRLVQDSPRFALALDAVEPLLLARLMTLRLIKRFQNRMRYLAERMRTQKPDTDWVAGLLYRVGRLVGKPLVPDTWFGGGESTLIPEEALILLGAIEQFSPAAFRSAPARFFRNLEESRPEAWQQTSDAYRSVRAAGTEPLNWPTEENIRLYRDFALPLLQDRRA
jgi:hypothetical protein